VTDGVLLARRLAHLRDAIAAGGPGPSALPRAGVWPTERSSRPSGAELAERLGTAVGGEAVRTASGHVVRVEPPAIAAPLQRGRLATLPGQPPPDVPLVCLDVETTGLGSGSGTLVFLVGLGWWERDSFLQMQLLCPDHGDEPALLAALEAAIPPRAWLVTYNGRSFDWPLLTTRYRMARRDAPAHAGHLDLLPHVRRLFRHRLGDARLQTVERGLLGIHREEDVEGWEIPLRYLRFVRGGPAEPLAAVVAHNAEDVRSLARLLGHLDVRYADPAERTAAPAGDLFALARGFTRARRHDEALACLEEADLAWRPAALGSSAWPFGAPAPNPAVVPRERIRAERARALRRLGRPADAAAAWEQLARTGGAIAADAWIEVAKLREHALGDPAGALEATATAARLLERARLLGAPRPAPEAALAARGARLAGRVRARDPADETGRAGLAAAPPG